MALTLSGSGITSANIVDGTITNTDINASAAIAASKLSGTGKVLQVRTGTNSSQTATSSTSFVDTGLSATITPSSTSSDILVLITSHIDSENTNVQARATISRGGTNLGEGVSGFGGPYGTSSRVGVMCSITYLDSPSTTSATTYTLQIKTSNGSYAVTEGSTALKSSITLIEIGA